MQKKAVPLRFIEPMECKAVTLLPENGWHYELKSDGYRAIAVKQFGEVSLYSRIGSSFNALFPKVVDALLKVRANDFIVDGELVAFDEHGRHSHSLLQNIRDTRAPVLFFVFDLLHLEGTNLIPTPIERRRTELEENFRGLPQTLRLSPWLQGKRDAVVAKARELEFEGVVAKRNGSVYEPGQRSGAWLKQKTQRRSNFVIGGYLGSRVDESLVDLRRNGGESLLDSVKNGSLPATRRQKTRGFAQ